jgi:hypothetical protein
MGTTCLAYTHKATACYNQTVDLWRPGTWRYETFQSIFSIITIAAPTKGNALGTAMEKASLARVVADAGDVVGDDVAVVLLVVENSLEGIEAAVVLGVEAEDAIEDPRSKVDLALLLPPVLDGVVKGFEPAPPVVGVKLIPVRKASGAQPHAVRVGSSIIVKAAQKGDAMFVLIHD